jgi:glycosyltransferase involved in cell wall biosynthesis
MRLLITTQAVDLDDPVLAFFHRWIEEFAKNADHVHVICLKEGRHALPKNVTVHSLGKESGRSMFKYVTRFYRYVWTLRREYDVVFVHMNPEYLVLGGRIWRMLKKSIGLWYIHPKSSWRLREGMRYTDVIFSASEKSFPHVAKKLVPVGLGVDTDFFSPGTYVPSSELRIMCAARIAPVKRVECMIEAAEELKKRRIPFVFDYYGEELPRDAAYAKEMRKKADTLASWNFRGRATPEEIRNAYRAHDVHVNATDSGSFDKAVFESMASGCITVASNTALDDVLPMELTFEEGDPISLAKALDHIAGLSEEDKQGFRERLRKIAVERYSLQRLVGRILDVLKYPTA